MFFMRHLKLNVFDTKQPKYTGAKKEKERTMLVVKSIPTVSIRLLELLQRYRLSVLTLKVSFLTRVLGTSESFFS